MSSMNEKLLSERDICTKFITPAVKQAGPRHWAAVFKEALGCRLLEFSLRMTRFPLTISP